MIELAYKLEGAEEAIGGFEAMAARAEDLSTPLRRLGQHHQRKAQRILASGERDIRSRHGRSGLEGSITFRLPEQNALEMGANKVYAASQQFGPPGGYYESSRPGGYLAIPFGENVRARGDPKYTSPRDVPDGQFFVLKGGLFFGIKHKRPRKDTKGKRYTRGTGKAIRLMTQAMGEGIELLFVLKKRVLGLAHKYVTHDPEDQDAWEKFAADWILRGKG